MTLRRIAVATDGLGGLDEPVSQHFGRCRAFTIVSVDAAGMRVTEIAQNPFAAEHRPGVVPKLVRGLNVDAVIAGGMGPRAAHVFERTGIQVGTGFAGKVGEAVDALLAGRLSATAGVHAHDGPNLGADGTGHGHAHRHGHGHDCTGEGGCGGHGHGHGHGQGHGSHSNPSRSASQ